MTRILADLPDDDIKWLDQLAAEQGKSRAAVVREAVEPADVFIGEVDEDASHDMPISYQYITASLFK